MRIAPQGHEDDFEINVIPLIPEHQLAHLKEPTFIERHKARADAARRLKVVTHCQRCFTHADIRHGFKVLNWLTQQHVRRTGHQAITPDVIAIAVFQFLQRSCCL